MKKNLQRECTDCGHRFIAAGSKHECPRCGSNYTEVCQSKFGKKPPRKEKWRDF